MYFQNESQLQKALTAYLKSLRWRVQREVSAGGGKVDIYSPKYLIECKLHLNRSSILRAATQLETYGLTYPRHKRVIAGLSPLGGKRAHRSAEFAMNAAERRGIQVWILDQEPAFVRFCLHTESKNWGWGWMWWVVGVVVFWVVLL